MKVAIMGSGALGAYYGARLAQAGHDVGFVARGAHLAAMRERGLRVRSELGDVTLAKVTATDDPSTLGAAELTIFAVKLWDTESAAQAARPLVGAKSTIVSLQNGVQKDDVLARVLGADRVLGGISRISTTIAEPGVIAQTGRMAVIVIGELDGRKSERLASLVSTLAVPGIEVVASDDIKRQTWEKFVFITGLAGVTALTRSTIGPIRENTETRSLLRDAMSEVVNVARATGVNVAADFADAQLKFCDTLPSQMRGSMAVDLERGNRLELPWFSGEVVRRGAALGIPTPVNGLIERALALYVNPATTSGTELRAAGSR